MLNGVNLQIVLKGGAGFNVRMTTGRLCLDYKTYQFEDILTYSFFKHKREDAFSSFIFVLYKTAVIV
jgi:hypothetical protein